MRYRLLPIACILFTLSIGYCQEEAEEGIEPLSPIDSIGAGQFRSVLATKISIGKSRRIDPDKLFLRDLATDLSRIARADAAGAAERPDGIRLRSLGATSYVIWEKDIDYTQARMLANRLGGRLVEIRSQDTQNLLADELERIAEKQTDREIIAWTGIINPDPEQADSWQYTSDGESIAYTAWNQGEPDGDPDDADVAVLTTRTNGDWIDVPSTVEKAGVVRFPIIEFPQIPRSAQSDSLATIATATLVPLEEFEPFDSLQGHAVAAIERQVIAPSQTALLNLRVDYNNQLLQLQASSDRSISSAAQSEIRRLNTIDSIEAAESFLSKNSRPQIRDAREQFADQIATLKAQRATAMQPILSTYRDALADIERQLTVAFRIEDAIGIRLLRNDLAKIIGEEEEIISTSTTDTTPEKREIYIDTPRTEWPTDLYTPGKPGRLLGMGKTWPGDQELDLSRAEPYDDFVKVAPLANGWVALRTNGTIVSTRDSLDGTRDIWRMEPRADGGALLFHQDNYITVNDSLSISSGDSVIAADQVVQISQCADSAIVTYKDGSAALCGEHFTTKERIAIESAFTGVVRHAAYRYGVYGYREDGSVVVAVLATPQRMLKEDTTKRLPTVNQEPHGRTEWLDVRPGGIGEPFFLTDRGEVWYPMGGWFPRSVSGLQPLPDDIDRDLRENVSQIWGGSGVFVALSSRGKWVVSRKMDRDAHAFEIALEERLQQLEKPISDLAIFSVRDEGDDEEAAFALWIEPSATTQE